MDNAIVESEIPTLSIPGTFAVTVKGLEITGRPAYEVWDEFGIGMLKVHKAIPRIIGDWLRYGELRYGEKFAQAEAITGYKQGYLRNVASVTARVELSQRRDSLSFSHDACVVTFTPEIQDNFFDFAEEYKLSSRDLKRVVDMAKDMAKEDPNFEYSYGDLQQAYQAVLDEEEYGGDLEVTYGVRFTATEIGHLLRKLDEATEPDALHLGIIEKLHVARGDDLTSG